LEHWSGTRNQEKGEPYGRKKPGQEKELWTRGRWRDSIRPDAERENQKRGQKKTQMNRSLMAQPESRSGEMGVRIPSEQDCLEKEHARVPYRWSSSIKRQDGLSDHWLEKEHQERTHTHCDGIQKQYHLRQVFFSS